jgi:hypothetical protein
LLSALTSRPGRRQEQIPFPSTGSVRIACPADRLKLSSGTAAPAAEGFDPGDFDSRARIPRGPWRAPTPQEIAQLAQRSAADGTTNFVAIVDLPEGLKRLAFELGAIACSAWHEGDHSQVAMPLQARLAEGLVDHFRGGPHARASGIVISRPGVPTLTSDFAGPALWGLHVDSWFGLPLSQRANAPNRLAVNIGSEDRTFQFIDLGVEQVSAILAARGEPQTAAYEAAVRFMELYPDYPIVSVRVAPGEAYIGGTENLIHDGSSVGMGAADALFTIIGEFPAPVGAAHDPFAIIEEEIDRRRAVVAEKRGRS